MPTLIYLPSTHCNTRILVLISPILAFVQLAYAVYTLLNTIWLLYTVHLEFLDEFPSP